VVNRETGLLQALFDETRDRGIVLDKEHVHVSIIERRSPGRFRLRSRTALQ
jgi:N-acetylglucosamine-6-phosphate deacetylase